MRPLHARSGAARFASAFLASALVAPTILLGCSGEDLPAPVSGPDVCAGHAFRDGAAARVFAVQPRIEREAMESYEAYRGHLMRLVNERVKPCLAKDRPNLIAFPEDVGLPASFLGSRGEKSRTAEIIDLAFFDLAKGYTGPMDHYEAIWPDLQFAQSLQLALTDTLWRAFYETMRDIATETGAYVVASTNVSGDIQASDNPADIAALGDPDLPGAAYVYVAKDRAIYNTAFVLLPTGEIVGRARKPYLVESEEQALLLTYGALRDAQPIDLGFAKLGVLTSKDAWMPDMVDRLAALGANVLVQPEAFSGWAVEELPGDWLPDVVQQSGWAATQKHGSYRYAVIPHLTGNLFDQIFDGQSAVITDAAPGEERHAYVGKEPQGGFLAVAPWAATDPGITDPALPIEARRTALRKAGEALLPGGENDNGYVETVVAADIDPASPFPAPAIPAETTEPAALGKSAPVAESPSGEQSSPAIAADGAGNVLVAWQDDRDGRPQIYLARSTDGGATFGEAAPAAPSMGAQITPAVITVGTSIYAAWQERTADEARVVVALSKDGGETFGAPVPLGPGSGEDDAWMPALAADNGTIYVAHVAGGNGNERIMVARAPEGDEGWQITLADGAPPAFDGLNIRNNQWAPAIAASGGEVAVAWVDFRNYNWDVFLARSLDGGATFGPAARVDDGTDDRERLHDDPALVYAPGGALLCGWSDVRKRRTPASARVALASGGPSKALNVAGSPGSPAEAIAWRPRMVSVAPGSVVAVWQDFRALRNDIFFAVSADDGATFGAGQRVDQSGGGSIHQRSPSVAHAGGGNIAVVWEDTRSGRRQIRYVTGTP